MEAVSKQKIILLLDYYNRGSMDLVESFKNTNLDFEALVINDDGFLPDEVTNVFEYFLQGFDKSRKPLFFNQISVPEYWEISGNNTSGSVHDKSRERGRIFYAEPKNKRLVKVVDWLDEMGNVRCSEHYNKYGYKYAVTTFNKKSQKVNKTYFDAEGREVLMENFVTSDIILNLDGQTLIFKNRTEFVSFFIAKNNWEENRIFFNSLSVPFFVSNSLQRVSGQKQDVLFWQESINGEIPGNMKMIFDGAANRCQSVVVQNTHSFERLKKLGAPRSMISQLGFIYTFAKENTGKPEALICTNTENVEKLKELLEELPMVKFHVTALTEMSGKLLAHERFENAIMYPNVKMSTLDRLFMQCDFYLDINHEGEIVEATRKAFLHNQLILAFKETKHSNDYIAKENCFQISDYKHMAKRIKSLLENKDLLAEAVKSQRNYGLAAKIEDYNF